jgi:hypothetical protein
VECGGRPVDDVDGVMSDTSKARPGQTIADTRDIRLPRAKPPS